MHVVSAFVVVVVEGKGGIEALESLKCLLAATRACSLVSHLDAQDIVFDIKNSSLAEMLSRTDLALTDIDMLESPSNSLLPARAGLWRRGPPLVAEGTCLCVWVPSGTTGWLGFDTYGFSCVVFCRTDSSNNEHTPLTPKQVHKIYSSI